MAELLATSDGVGAALAVTRSHLDTAASMAWIVALVGSLLAIEYLLLEPIKRKVESWRNARAQADEPEHPRVAHRFGYQRVLDDIDLRIAPARPSPWSALRLRQDHPAQPGRRPARRGKAASNAASGGRP
jgi:hypothetical protein